MSKEAVQQNMFSNPGLAATNESLETLTRIVSVLWSYTLPETFQTESLRPSILWAKLLPHAHMDSLPRKGWLEIDL